MLRGYPLRKAGAESPSLSCHSQRDHNCTSIAGVGVAALLWNDLEAIKYCSKHLIGDMGARSQTILHRLHGVWPHAGFLLESVKQGKSNVLCPARPLSIAHRQ